MRATLVVLLAMTCLLAGCGADRTAAGGLPPLPHAVHWVALSLSDAAALPVRQRLIGVGLHVITQPAVVGVATLQTPSPALLATLRAHGIDSLVTCHSEGLPGQLAHVEVAAWSTRTGGCLAQVHWDAPTHGPAGPPPAVVLQHLGEEVARELTRPVATASRDPAATPPGRS